MAREVGISKIKLFPLITDEVGKPVEYDKDNAFYLPWAVNLETETEFSEGSYYADNKIENSIRKVSSMNITLEVSSDTPPELDAKITGRLHIGAKSSTTADTMGTEFALAYEIAMDDDTVRKRILYKVKLARTGQTNATQEDSIEGQTYTYEGTALPLVGEGGEGAFDMIMDEKEVNNYVAPPAGVPEDVVQNQFVNFFVEPILPTREDEVQVP